MGAFLTPGDLPGLDEDDVNRLIEDAEALAILVAPCLADEDLSELKVAQARAILRGVALRWNDAGTGVTTQLTAGPFSQTTTPQVRRNAFWPSEIKDLQKICRDADEGKAYSVDTAPAFGSPHVPWCSVNFGANFCSCGVDIAGSPIYGIGVGPDDLP